MVIALIWILWITNSAPRYSQYDALGAYEQKRACEAERLRWFREHSPQEQREGGPHLVCLPDTVNPRCPQGGNGP